MPGIEIFERLKIYISKVTISLQKLRQVEWSPIKSLDKYKIEHDQPEWRRTNFITYESTRDPFIGCESYLNGLAAVTYMGIAVFIDIWLYNIYISMITTSVSLPQQLEWNLFPLRSRDS